MVTQFEPIFYGFLVVGGIGALLFLVYTVFKRYQWRKTMDRRRLFLYSMRRLPIRQWNDDLEAFDTCCVCFITFRDLTEITILPCRHSCHLHCAEEWVLRGNLRCPLCSREIIPNARIFKRGDMVGSPETVRGVRLDEMSPLIQTSMIEELTFSVGDRREFLHLHVPSDHEDSSSTSNSGLPSPEPTTSPPQ